MLTSYALLPLALAAYAAPALAAPVTISHDIDARDVVPTADQIAALMAALGAVHGDTKQRDLEERVSASLGGLFKSKAKSTPASTPASTEASTRSSGGGGIAGSIAGGVAAGATLSLLNTGLSKLSNRSLEERAPAGLGGLGGLLGKSKAKSTSATSASGSSGGGLLGNILSGVATGGTISLLSAALSSLKRDALDLSELD